MENIPWSVSYLWHRVLCRLEDQLGGVAVSCWMDQTEAICLENNQLVLKERSEFRRMLISGRACALIQQAVKGEFGLDVEVVLRED